MNIQKKQINRRMFLGTLGGSCAVLGAASFIKKEEPSQMGPPPGMNLATKEPKNATEGKIKEVSTDVLVVGGGMAGVFAAVKAHDNGAKVLLVDKGAVGRSGQTPFARGIFRYDEEITGMSKAKYLQKTAVAAERMNNPVYTKLMLDHSGERIYYLTSWFFLY
jgi:hypothetical protein